MLTSINENLLKSGDQYPEFEIAVRHSSELNDGPLFTTDAKNLFELYLAGLPESVRQYYNCHACKDFLERYGGLVTITESGEVIPAMWNEEVPELFKESVRLIKHEIKKSVVTGVFLSRNPVLGTPVTRGWTHLHAINKHPYVNLIHTPYEVMAEKKADFTLLKKSLKEYPIEIINQVLLILKSDALYRSEKVLGIVEWFKNLYDIVEYQKNSRLRDNMIWRAVALAPPGYCHIKNTVISTLLDDLMSGMSYEEAASRFAAKMHPLQYQRPQVNPTAGNIERAEQIFAKLGIEKSLIRRFARLDEIQTIWRPINQIKQVKSQAGIFSHIKPKTMFSSSKLPEINLPKQNITWRKFLETVLPEVIQMKVHVKSRDNFCALLTAEYLDSPPIIQWDNVDQRNPFNWYVYSSGSACAQWNLTEGYVNVTGICYQPSMWYNENKHQGKSILFILEGAKDSKYEHAGNALFPEVLKSELREIRSTIEAYSRKAKILGYEEASACGLRSRDGSFDVTVRVVTSLGRIEYHIDRWE